MLRTKTPIQGTPTRPEGAGRFAGQTVIVTGAGSGIGFGIVELFAAAGASVVLNDVDPALAASAAVAINAKVGATAEDPRVTVVAGDVADVGIVQGLVGAAIGRTGRLDHVVANAGLTLFAPFLECTPQQFERVVGVNLRGSYFLAQAAARAMIARNAPGRIVLLSSVNGFRGLPNLSAYAATKAGINQLTKSIAVELGPYGINVNAVAPGATLTERTRLEDPDYEANFASVCPIGRVATPLDIAHVVAFLCGPESRHVSGQTILVDGGWANTGPLPQRYQKGEVAT